MNRYCLWVIAIFLVEAQALAAGLIQHQGNTLVRTDEPAAVCQEDNIACRTHLLRLSSGTRFLNTEVSLLGSKAAQWNVSLAVTALQSSYPIGRVRGAKLIATQIDRGYRFQLSALDAQSLFFCQRPSPDKSWTLPLLGPLKDRCLPNASWGLNLGLGHLMWDQWSGRFQGDWFRIGPSYNFYGNGQGIGVLRNNLHVYADLSFRTLSYGTLSTHIGRSRDSDLGMQVGLRYQWKSPSIRFQWESDLSHRFVLSNSALYQVLIKSRFTYAFLLASETLGKLGLELESSYASTPANSFSTFSSDQSKLSSQIGIYFGIEPFKAL